MKPRRSKLSESKYNNNKHNLLVFDKIWKKYNEIQLTKNKMDLNNRKIKKHQPSQEYIYIIHTDVAESTLTST